MDVIADPDLDRARAGDDDAFARLIAPLRPELHAHCYRMLGSPHDADDALQNAFVQAWRGLAGYAGRASLRSWLYTVATRCCLDVVAARGRRALPVDLGPSSPRVIADDAARTDVAWLAPYPTPEDRVEQREAVELAFVAALQHLPGNQRAALLLFEVLDFSAAEIAETMGTSVASVNSALQRARAVVAERVPERDALVPSADARAIADEFAAALERGDADALLELLAADVTWSMPPLPAWYAGFDTVAAFAREVPFGACGSWRVRRVDANGAPALALYLRPDGEITYRAWSITVLSMGTGGITAITSFLDAEPFAAFGLTEELP